MVSSTALIARLGDNAPDPQVARVLIAAATRYLQLHTGWYWGVPRDFTRHHEGRGISVLRLDGMPFATPTVTEAAAPGLETEVVTDFVVRGTTLVRTWPAFWHLGYEYTVTYRTGYLVDTGPAAEREAVMQYALALWQQSSPLAIAIASGITGEELEDYSWEADSEVSSLQLDRVPEVMLAVINTRRRKVV